MLFIEAEKRPAKKKNYSFSKEGVTLAIYNSLINT
mgnify:CR=1 FL=1